METEALSSLDDSRVNDSLPALPVPDQIVQDYVDCGKTVGLTFHILECGRNDAYPRPLVLLLHGFPELAYSWRKIMPTISSAGFHVVAVDQRGYGRTSGWHKASYQDTNLTSFSMRSYAKDTVALVFALGHRSVHCVIGHDVGAAVASMCAVSRPDLFTSCILMSHPFKGFPDLPSVRRPSDIGQDHSAKIYRDANVHDSLAALPEPRKHYKWYNATATAANDWNQPVQGLGPFLRGYFHLKSADCAENMPLPLKSWTAEELAKMPGYYVMPLHSTMPQTVASDMVGQDSSATESWLSEDDLQVYVGEWTRTGFQGGLNFYRVTTSEELTRDINEQYAGAKIIVPCVFISGDKDWGNYQEPGALDNMRHICTKFHGFKTIHGAGHWPQQEQPGQVAAKILDFIWQAHRPQPMSAPITQRTFSSWSPMGISVPPATKSVYSSPAIGTNRRLDVTREDPTLVQESLDDVGSQKQVSWSASAAESSSRNDEVYQQVAEETQAKLQEPYTPMEGVAEPQSALEVGSERS